MREKQRVCFGMFVHRWKGVFCLSVCIHKNGLTLMCVCFSLHDSMAPVSEIVTRSQSVSHSAREQHINTFGRLWLPSPLWDWEWKGRELGERQKYDFLSVKSCPSFGGLGTVDANCVTGCTPSPNPSRNTYSCDTLQHFWC